jgi:hypothetical protein
MAVVIVVFFSFVVILFVRLLILHSSLHFALGYQVHHVARV